MAEKSMTQRGVVCLIAAGVGVIATLGSAWLVQIAVDRDAAHMELVRRQQALIREVSATADDAARGLIPDFPLEPSIEDVLAGRDLVLEQTLDLIAEAR